MSEALVLPTVDASVVLREPATVADDEAYFEMVAHNRAMLERVGFYKPGKYPTVESVTYARLYPRNPDRRSFRIIAREVLVGSTSIKPDERGAQIGIWIDERQQGRGFATIAINALAAFGIDRYGKVHADVPLHNSASRKAMERAGFTLLGVESQRYILQRTY